MIQAPARATTPMTALIEPGTRWLPWLTLPVCPMEFSGQRPTPEKNSTARMMNRTPTTARAMTSRRFEPAPPETVELTFLLLRRAGISGAVVRLLEGGISRCPAVGPPGGDHYVRQRTTCRFREVATSGKRPKPPLRFPVRAPFGPL